MSEPTVREVHQDLQNHKEFDVERIKNITMTIETGFKNMDAKMEEMKKDSKMAHNTMLAALSEIRQSFKSTEEEVETHRVAIEVNRSQWKWTAAILVVLIPIIVTAFGFLFKFVLDLPNRDQSAVQQAVDSYLSSHVERITQ